MPMHRPRRLPVVSCASTRARARGARDGRRCDQVVGKNFDGRGAPERRVARAKHLAHASGADGFDDFVYAEAIAALQGHGDDQYRAGVT